MPLPTAVNYPDSTFKEERKGVTRLPRAGRQALQGKRVPAWYRPAGTAWNTAGAPLPGAW